MSIDWQTYQSEPEWAKGIAAALTAQVKDGGTMIVTGGSSPAPIYQILSGQDLPWADITLLLSDDRCVPDDHDQSNLRLVRSYLSQTGANIPALTEDAAHAALPAKTGLLGMGPDGHILSWFAEAGGFDDALNSDKLTASIDASNSKIAQPITDRISLSRKAVGTCADWHIAIKGDEKRNVIEQAIADPSAFPIGELLRMDQLHITIHWCPS